jgi:hypothetical protein
VKLSFFFFFWVNSIKSCALIPGILMISRKILLDSNDSFKSYLMGVEKLVKKSMWH